MLDLVICVVLATLGVTTTTAIAVACGCARSETVEALEDWLCSEGVREVAREEVEDEN